MLSVRLLSATISAKPMEGQRPRPVQDLDQVSWQNSRYCVYTVKCLQEGIGAIKRVRHLVPQATLQNIFSALVQPHFDYCNVVWGNCGVTLQQKLQKLQNRAARVLTYSSYDASADNLIKILDWKDIACQQQNARATMVYKCLHGLAPEYLCSKFSKRDSVYSLRDSEIKSMSRYREQITSKTVLAIAVLSLGIIYHVKQGLQSLLVLSRICYK